MSDIKVCSIRTLPPDLQDKARQLAISLNPLNAVVGAGPAHAAMTVRKKWPNLESPYAITVAFMDGTSIQRQRIQPYFHEWEKYCNLKFVFILDPSQATLRVSFAQEGSWSYVGTDALLVSKNEPAINFGWLTDTTPEREYQRTGLHEVGHAIGFEHELQSPGADFEWDVPVVLKYYTGPPNNWKEDEVNEQVINRLAPTGVEYTPFDPHSIMCYWIPPQFDKKKKGTFQNSELSVMDKQFAHDMYPPLSLIPEPSLPVSPTLPSVVIPEVKNDGSIRFAKITMNNRMNEFKWVIPSYGSYRIWTSYVGAPVQVIHPSDPNNPVINAIQQFTSQIPQGEYRIRVLQAKPEQEYFYRISARKLK